MDDGKHKTAYVLIHGFAGSRQEIKILSDIIIQRNLDTYCLLLKGHEETRKELSRSNYRQWLDSAETAIKEISEKYEDITLIGFSMGGLISVNMCERYNIKKLVLVNCPVYIWDLNKILNNLIYDIKHKSSESIKKYAKSPFDIPIKSMVEFLKLLKVTKDKFKNIKCKTLIIQGKSDDTVNWKSAEYIYSQVTEEKQIKYYDAGVHQIFQSDLAGDVAEDIMKYLVS